MSEEKKEAAHKDVFGEKENMNREDNMPKNVVHVEETPNPATRKFVCSRDVSPASPLAFSSAEEATPSPFATHVFAVNGVGGVFLGHNFVSVTKEEAADWDVLEPNVRQAVQEACEADKLLWDDTLLQHQDGASGQDSIVGNQEAPKAEPGTIARDIQDLLDQRVRPFVARDGGDITFHRFEDGVVYLTLRGACSGCPSSGVTLKNGVENMLRHFIPEVQRVEAVDAAA